MPQSLTVEEANSFIPMTPDESQEDQLEAIAVVGFGLNFPQDADTPENFWKMLVDGRSAMTDVPKDRWNIDSFYHPSADRHDSMNARGGHFLKEDISLFDAPFFSMPPAEAVCMDPQQRSLLECTYHALENAGMPMASIIGSRTSCYVGSFSREYEAMINRDPQMQAKYVAVGTGTAMLANRLSWFYDLRGSSISLDTACSSSLVALHLAVDNLRSGESNMSIVAGCNLMLNPDTNSIPLSNLGFLGRDSVCYSFDHRANGYARGEGTAVMVLKPIKQALKDNDIIRAVIRNTGTNQDGRTPGITQPSKEAQASLIQETYHRAGLDFKDTGFFEAHGTGTPIGDPREAGAIGIAFKDHVDEPLVVGAVKSNIGHLEGASGLAGLIKTILILEKGVIPRNIWFEKLNPEILADEWKLKFPTDTMAWPKEGLRRASVNSFGYGGANAHVIVDDAYHYLKSRKLAGKHQTVSSPPKVIHTNGMSNGTTNGRTYGTTNGTNNGTEIQTTDPEKYRLFVWSASDEGGLRRLSTSYQKYFQTLHSEKADFLDNLAYTLSRRRSNLPWKSFLVAISIENIHHELSAGSLSKPVRSSASLQPNLVFVFTGQGAQWYAMGRELMIYPTFQKVLSHAEKYLTTSLGCAWKLTEELKRSKDSSNVDNPALAQPLCTVIQIALVELLEEWNISPHAVVGHSSGEIAAAYCAGGISKESAYKIAYHRGALANRLAQKKRRNGAMIAVALSEAEIVSYLDQVAAQLGPKRLVVGCVNSPKNITLTGDEECVDLMKSLMNTQRIFARKLQVPVAYHSSHMQEIASEYLKCIRGIVPREVSLTTKAFPTMFSSVTGALATSDRLSQPDYWVENMVSQVKFAPALSELCATLLRVQPEQTEIAPLCLVEVGPHAALQRAVNETILADDTLSEASYDTTLRNGVNAIRSMMDLVGKLHCRGYKSDILALNCPQRVEADLKPLCDLPEYPFNHSQGYWLESRISENYRFSEFPRHELLGVRTTDWNPLEAKWRNMIRVSELPWIKDHKFNGSELYPAAGMLVMAIEASRQTARPNSKIASYNIENVSFFKALLVSLDAEGVETQFHLRPAKDNTNSSDRKHFNLYLCSSGQWAEICCGTIVTEYEEVNDAEILGPRNDDHLHSIWKNGVARCTRLLDSKDLYENLASFGFGFGPTFQALKQVRWNNECEATACLEPREWMKKVKDSHITLDHVIHPTALDAVMHLTAAAESKGTSNPLRTMVPTKIEKLWISNDLLLHAENQTIQIFTHPTFQGYRDTEFSVVAFDNLAHECQIVLEGYRATAITSLEPSSAGDARLAFDIDWKPAVDLLTDEECSTVCCATVNKDDFHDPIFIDKAELLCTFYIYHALEELNRRAYSGESHHTSKYIEWMRKQVDDYTSANPIPNPEENKPSLSDEEYFQMLSSELESGAEVDLINEVGKNLARILIGDVDALGILFNDDLAKGFYGGLTFVPSNKKASTYIDLLAHKDPTLKILEIGAGTGGSTASILDKLGKHGNDEKGEPRLGKYTYTDISPGFFEAASQRFSDFVDVMEFKVLDIEKDPIEQGLNVGEYDVVVASAVLHATANLENTLGNVHKMLKPNGTLLIIEPCNLEALRIPFIFGLLPGWWLSTEEHRFWGPLMSDDTWSSELKNAGFTGADICLRDFEDHRHTMSVIISKPAGDKISNILPPIPKTVIVVAERYKKETPLVAYLRSALIFHGISTDVIGCNEITSADLKDSVCISLLEIDNPFLCNITDDEWERLKTIVRSANGVLWLTRGAENDPALGMITGLARGLRSEYPHLNFVEVALEENCTTETIVKHSLNVLRKSINSDPIERNENEYWEKDRILYVNRVVEANYLNTHLTARTATQKPQQRVLGSKPDTQISLAIHNPGLLNTLRFEEGEVGRKELSPDQIEVHVKAAGLTFKDVQIALGQIPGNYLGLEFSGIVVRVGSDVPEETLKSGDRICGVAAGAFSTKLHVPISQVFKIPDSISFTTAAAIPVSFCIARHSLVNLAKLKKGESILIHSAAGGVGQAAIQLARTAEAVIYCTVGSQEKKELLCTKGLISAASPLKIYGSSEVENAFRFLQSGKSTGKTVVEMRSDDIITAVPSSQPTYSFREDSSYVIIGGLGGLGKSTATWMADRGAKHLILLGRSGATSQAALEFVAEMELKGIAIAAPPCDVTDEVALLAVLDMCSKTMPPIKGCIQGSMVLRDGLFESMSYENYQDSVRPKVQGSWNLHKHLPDSLDFFILLASAGGIVGTRGQSNYASGNTYQDALARYRVSRGLKCVSLDLGLIQGVGFAAENRDTLLAIKKLGYRGIHEKEYLAILDYLCDPSLPMMEDPLKSQIITGLEIPKVLLDTAEEAHDAEDWARWVRRPLFRNLAAMEGLDASKSDTGSVSESKKRLSEVDYKAAFAAAGTSAAAAARVASSGLREKLARTLRIPEEDIETQRSIHTYGVDSLVAVDLRYWLAKEMKADLSIFEIMGDDSLGKLSWLIAKRTTLFAGEISDAQKDQPA
ncbi:hypothetical protein SS1G_11404 [Sclerotinia sclerotiorum 1980 UF-70]|uniref:Uncharacterized protein n=1 Tax=Sclerotinia sclerotiorum (strain ATCC 18683 / 1980 / Ss-1) TaxID=665079 RepID=A7F1D4_SCLS1|nr:hypothetical protein SS1G_11404 [Sclerotinia sclerotiorum 1980 UF-70]EDN95526.1 hypothetical protein SS1G_11404 [Sclerotinia sclerotiorum 1980 UF-70]